MSFRLANRQRRLPRLSQGSFRLGLLRRKFSHSPSFSFKASFCADSGSQSATVEPCTNAFE
uniref:Uncharacterized protein n=2 Tax=Culex quinquefasciatus TaxID=7176 RepID=A0A1S4KGW1_CULQU